MPRFSLSNDEGEDAQFEHEEEHEEEPEHPLGFEFTQWGPSSTWIGLEPPSSFLASPGRSTYALDDDGDDEHAFMTTPHRQAYPPLSSYIPAASTSALLKYRAPIVDEEQLECDNPTEDDDVMLLQRMLQRRSLTRTLAPPTPIKPLTPFQETMRHVQQELQVERRRMEQEHAANTKAVKAVCLELENEAVAILETRQLEEETARRIQQALEAREKQKEQDKLQQREKDRNDREAKQAAKEEKTRQEEQKRMIREAKQTEGTEYVQKAKKLVSQLVAVRESIEPFENNKAVSKRRLAMKKIVRGKINTLSENAAKIQEVATDIARAISDARSEDDQIKQALHRKDPGFTPDMARGKRYLVDLVASNTIQRVQAEGFNGVRGDGFPLANMLAIVSLENKELVPILAAHIYTVCPTAIPTLPTLAPDVSEEEFMSSLGMLKGKNGEYESFDRFLSRTENIVALVANIMSSSPPTHALLGGHHGAVDWLTRFLDLLPPPPAVPLPLVTAPVLYGFLTGAGHMMANKHPDTFETHVKVIVDEVLPRLDDGPIGKPSSIRMAKLMEGGFEKFRTNLPERALPELYFGARGSKGQGSSGGGRGTFGNSSAAGAFGINHPFTGSTRSADDVSQNQSTNSSITLFGIGGSNPFVAPSSTSGGFGSANHRATTGGFGSIALESTSSSTPFGASPSGAGGFGSSSSTEKNSNTFGGTPFGVAGSTKGGSNAATLGQSPFGGVASSKPSPFGGSNSATPFGISPGGVGFGGSSSGTGTDRGWGAFRGGQFPNRSPFENGGGGFGGASSNNGISFGSAGGRDSGGKQPCRFFAQGRCKFGDSCKFSHETGGGGNFGASGSGGGEGSGNSAGRGRGFGGGSTPFSGGFNSNPFGAPRR